jgi:UDPglucose 6-dehydrogenase
VLPKDVSALKQLAGNSGYHFQLLSAVIEVNELQKRKVIGKLKRNLGSLVGKRIGCSAWRSSRTPTTCARRRRSCSPAGCRARAPRSWPTTPVAEEEARKVMQNVDFASSAVEVARGADAVVLVTEWDEFKSADWTEIASVMRGDVVVDGRNALDPETVRAAGLHYEGVGRRPSPSDGGSEPAVVAGPGAEPASAGSGPG